MFHFLLATSYLALLSTAFPNVPQGKAAEPPKYMVNLPYGYYEAKVDNDLLVFSDVRYALKPERWQLPQLPAKGFSETEKGSSPRICPQAHPQWLVPTLKALGMALDYPGTTEDCLFLDVVLPKHAFGKGKPKLPVLVWIHGGGFTSGHKGGVGSHNSLVKSSFQAQKSGGIIFVAINYRLGALGFSSGTEFNKAKGVPNVGLRDQLFALRWVNEFIGHFNGDPDKITVMAQSAGAASVMHLITAEDGKKTDDRKKKAPFKRAIFQSPGWVPARAEDIGDGLFNDLLKRLGANDFTAASQADTKAVIKANSEQIAASRPGSFTYGPVVDGEFIKAQPTEQLLRKAFDQELEIMVGHTTQEGLGFAPQNINSNEAFNAFVKQTSPKANVEAIFNDYKTIENPSQRVVALLSDNFRCNSFYLNKAFNGQAHGYVVDGGHGADVPYTFFNGRKGIDPVVASKLQRFITGFALNGNPEYMQTLDSDFLELYWPETRRDVPKEAKTVADAFDEMSKKRCLSWQDGTYFKPTPI